MNSAHQVATPKARRTGISKAQFIHQIAGNFSSAFLYPEEGAAIVFGRLETARRVAKQAQFRWLMTESGIFSITSPLLQNETSKAPLTPVPIISRLNRSKTYPFLVPMEPASIAKLGQRCNAACEYHQSGSPHSWILDLLAGSGLSWTTAAGLVAKITGQQLQEKEIQLVEQARRFWVLFAEARARYLGFVETEGLLPWRGDFGYFDRRQFESILPGCVLADHFQRREYLLSYIDEGHGIVDLYNTMGRPLCRHPFTPDYAITNLWLR